MASLFSALGGSAADILIRLDDADNKKYVDVKGEKEQMESCPVYLDGEVRALGPLMFPMASDETDLEYTPQDGQRASHHPSTWWEKHQTRRDQGGVRGSHR